MFAAAQTEFARTFPTSSSGCSRFDRSPLLSHAVCRPLLIAGTILDQQNKNWRKYYVALERRALQLQEKLLGVCKDRDDLVVEKAQLQDALDHMRERLEMHKRQELETSGQLMLWKKKMSKLKALVTLKEHEVAERTREADAITDEFARFRRSQRSKGLQALLSSSQQHKHQHSADNTNRDEGGSNNTQSLLRADNATLKNQLVRAESDSVLLVRAVDVACKHQGELPEPVRVEVNRIAQRLLHNQAAAS